MYFLTFWLYCVHDVPRREGVCPHEVGSGVELVHKAAGAGKLDRGLENEGKKHKNPNFTSRQIFRGRLK